MEVQMHCLNARGKPCEFDSNRIVKINGVDEQGWEIDFRTGAPIQLLVRYYSDIVNGIAHLEMHSPCLSAEFYQSCASVSIPFEQASGECLPWKVLEMMVFLTLP